MNDSLACLPPTRRSELELSDPSVRSALRRGLLIAIRRGVLVGRTAFDATQGDPAARHALLAVGAILSTRGAPTFACLGSAGLLHGFKRLGRSPERVRLYRRKGPPWRDADVAVLTCGLPDGHVTEVQGVPCTTGVRTVVDLARWPGIRGAREVVTFADGRAASPLESISRVAFRDMGLPAPELQAILAWDEFGNPRIIVDFYWPDFGVVGEADGLMKYDEDSDQAHPLRAEKLRQEELEGIGYIVVRWTWDDIWRRPEWVAMRLRRAFVEGARRRRTA